MCSKCRRGAGWRAAPGLSWRLVRTSAFRSLRNGCLLLNKIQLGGERPGTAPEERAAKSMRIKVAGIPAALLNNWDTTLSDVISQLRSRAHAISEVIFFQSFLVADVHSFQIAPCQTPIGWVPFGEKSAGSSLC